MIGFSDADYAAADAEGWNLFDCDSEGHDPVELERVDDAPTFDDDPAAWRHVVTLAAWGSPLHVRALQVLALDSPGEWDRVHEWWAL